MIRRFVGNPRLLSTLRSSHLVNVQNAPSDFDVDSAVVYSNFLSEDEGNSIIEDVQMRMKRYDHLSLP
jgi:hypothetical protein